MPKPPLTPAELRLRGQFASNTRWSKPGAREAQSEKIRAARLRVMEDRVDPDRVLDPAERAKLAGNALSAEMQKLAFMASRARKKAS